MKGSSIPMLVLAVCVFYLIAMPHGESVKVQKVYAARIDVEEPNGDSCIVTLAFNHDNVVGSIMVTDVFSCEKLSEYDSMLYVPLVARVAIPSNGEPSRLTVRLPNEWLYHRKSWDVTSLI